MKKLLLTFILVNSISVFNAQVTFTASSDVANYLEGNWTFFRQCGGLMGGCQTATTLGYTKALIFNKITGVNDSVTFKLFKNGNLVSSGRTKINPTSSVYGSMWTLDNMKDESNQVMPLSLFNSKTDSVFLADNCVDCYTYTYSRNKGGTFIEEKDNQKSIRVIPNPAISHFSILFVDDLQGTRVVISDLNGRILIESSDTQNIDISNLSPGLYQVNLQNAAFNYNGRLIKE